MINTRSFNRQEVKAAYNYRSKIYSKLVAPLEFDYHLRALDKAAIQPDDKILEVAVGPGMTLLELVKRVNRNNVVYGVDLSSRMLELTRQRVEQAGYHNIKLAEAEARALDFPDNTFDLLYNGYMLDLIPVDEMLDIMLEFKRVLKPGGRLVLLNMSKADQNQTNLRERLYRVLPSNFVLYFMGGCRPVLMKPFVQNAGFVQVERTYLGGKAPSEIVTAQKPAADL